MYHEKPSRINYTFSIVIIVIGCFVGGISAYTFFNRLFKDFHRTTTQGNSIFTLDKKGSYTIYLETNHSNVNLDEYKDLNIIVRSASFKNIELTQPAFTTTYNVEGRHGISYRGFKVEEPGEHKILCWYNNQQGPDVVIAIKKNFTYSETIIFSSGIIISIFCLIFGLIWFLRTQSKRKTL